MLRAPRINPRPRTLHVNPSGVAVAIVAAALGAVGAVGYLVYKTKSAVDKAVDEGKLKRVEKAPASPAASKGKGFVKVEPPWLPLNYDPAAWEMLRAWQRRFIYKVSSDKVLMVTPMGAYACTLVDPTAKSSKLKITGLPVPMTLAEYKKVLKFLPDGEQDNTMPWIITSYAVERPDGTMPGFTSGSAPPYIPTKAAFEAAIEKAGGIADKSDSPSALMRSIGHAARVL